jgi:hypothetical protein
MRIVPNPITFCNMKPDKGGVGGFFRAISTFQQNGENALRFGELFWARIAAQIDHLRCS